MSDPRGPAASHSASAAPEATRFGAWMALAAALLGWMFDGAEMGIFSMIGRQAVKDLLATSDESVVGLWFGVITAGFLVGAATGGVLFGWLGDRIGRVRAMMLSVLTYALFTGFCGLATAAWQVGVLRFIAALGMGGEWSLGVALVMEVWPNRSRAFMAGLIGAAANVGYMVVGFVGLGLAAILADLHAWLLRTSLPEHWVEALVRNDGWRVMMLLGTLPALLTFFIRLFVPESPKWQHEHSRGATGGWASRDLLGVLLGATGPALIVYLWAWNGPDAFPHTMVVRVIGSLLGLAVAVAGYTFPLIRYLQRQQLSDPTAPPGEFRTTLGRMLLGAGLAGVALLGTWGSAQWIPSWADELADRSHAQRLEQATSDEQRAAVQREGKPRTREHAQVWLAVGAITGTIAAALAGDLFGRRLAYFGLCVLSLGSTLFHFSYNTDGSGIFLASSFAVGFFTAGFYGWLPLYLPELFRTRVRATAQGFGFNFGRILAAIGALQTGNLVRQFDQPIRLLGLHYDKGYPAACATISLIYVVGMVLIWLAPETRGRDLPA